MPVIAMTREIGTRGGQVAAGVAERLGLTVVHHELVEHDIAERTGMTEDTVHRHLEGQASILERWTLDHKQMSRCTAQEILELAAKGDVLIRGWGAAYLLRSIPHVVCVRICAPMHVRERVLMERLDIDSSLDAQREIEQSDAAHSSVMRRLFGVDQQDPSLYAAVLNTGRIPVTDCVDHIVRLTECSAFRETPQSRAVLTDELILARARFALDRRFGSGSTENGLEVHVFNGKVLLSGATTDEHLIVAAVRLLQDVEGVTGVESKVSHVAFVPHVH